MQLVKDFGKYAIAAVLLAAATFACSDNDPQYTATPTQTQEYTMTPRLTASPTASASPTPIPTPVPTATPIPTLIPTPVPIDYSLCLENDPVKQDEFYVLPNEGVRRRMLPELNSGFNGASVYNTELSVECERDVGDQTWYRVTDGTGDFWVPNQWVSADPLPAYVAPPTQDPVQTSLPIVSPGGGNKIILTFDDSGSYAGPMLDVLAQYDVKGIFFPVGNWGNYDLIQRMMDEGHLVGNHTYSHEFLTTLSVDQMTYQINNGPPTNTNLLRPPYLDGCWGSGRDYVESVAIPLGWELYCADMDTGDWRGYSVQQIIDSTLEQAHPGGIPIFHMHKENSLLALPTIIEELQAAGYELHW